MADAQQRLDDINRQFADDILADRADGSPHSGSEADDENEIEEEEIDVESGSGGSNESIDDIQQMIRQRLNNEIYRGMWTRILMAIKDNGKIGRVDVSNAVGQIRKHVLGDQFLGHLREIAIRRHLFTSQSRLQFTKVIFAIVRDQILFDMINAVLEIPNAVQREIPEFLPIAGAGAIYHMQNMFMNRYPQYNKHVLYTTGAIGGTAFMYNLYNRYYSKPLSLDDKDIPEFKEGPPPPTQNIQKPNTDRNATGKALFIAIAVFGSALVLMMGQNK